MNSRENTEKMQTKVQKDATTKTHRRSRSGCFTCRLRRKKCDEGKSKCKACKHLGLRCDYKRPSWWGNVEQRKKQKEAIKILIKKTKQNEKVSAMGAPPGANAVPQLSYSVPSSECYSEDFSRPTRSHSVDSGYSLEYDYENDTLYTDMPDMLGHQPQIHYIQTFNPNFPNNYEYEVLTENSSYIDPMPMPRKDMQGPYCEDMRSRTDSAYGSVILPSMPLEIYPDIDASHEFEDQTTVIPSHLQPGVEDVYDYNYVDFGALGQTAPIPLMPGVDKDQLLIEHFVKSVLQLIVPVLDINIPNAHQRFILPAIQNNRAYLHSCLAVSAMHLKATQEIEGTEPDEDILRHRKSTIEELCQSMNTNTDQLQILEAILGVILFRSSVASVEDNLPDIEWWQHLQPAMKLIHQMDLTSQLGPLDSNSPSVAFNLTTAAWIDVLGSTMLGRPPVLANTYRTKYLEGESSGFSELMGCDDRVMYLISEIACLEAQKKDGLQDEILLEHVTSLAHQIDLTEPTIDPVADFLQPSPEGVGRIKLLNLMTAAFRCAARIYLTSLVPGCKDGVAAPFDHHDNHIKILLNKLTTILSAIPSGIDGFDRSLVWVYLIGGSVATPDSSFRSLLESRTEELGDEATFGSFGSMCSLIHKVWQHQDVTGAYVHWRDVMHLEGWNLLLL